MSDQEFRLKYSNNWESDEYTLSDPNNTRIKSLALVAIKGDIYAVKTERVSVEYSDHGKRGWGTSNHYFVSVPVLGRERLIDLNTVVPTQEVFAVEFTM